MSPRRRTRDPRGSTGGRLGTPLPAALTPRPEAVPPPEHDHAIDVPGTGRMVMDLARRAMVGLLLSLAAFAIFVVAVSLRWPGAAIFLIFLLFWVVALTVGRRPVRALRAWRDVRRTPWRSFEARVSAGSRGERIELRAPGEDDAMHMRVYPDRRTRELLRSSATYARVWFAGNVTGHGVVVPAGGGIPVPTLRVVLVPVPGRTARYARYGTSGGRVGREERAAERAAIRAEKENEKHR